MRIVVSDASCLIDLKKVSLLGALFSLPQMNPVPFLIVDGEDHHLAGGCNISNIVPTVREPMRLEAPKERPAPAVIVKKKRAR